MDVVISAEVPSSIRVNELQTAGRIALRQNSAIIGSPGEQLELVAIIIPAGNYGELSMHFALRSVTDQKIRCMIGALTEGESVTAEDLLQTIDGFIDPVQFCKLIERIVEIYDQLKREPSLHRIQ